MRWNVLAGVVTALAFLIPAAPAAAQAAKPGLDKDCQTIERKEYKDLRKLITIDLDTATDIDVRVQANQIMFEASAESLPLLPREMQKALDGSADDRRAFLKTGMWIVWSDDLRVLVARSLSVGGPHVKAAAGKVLDDGTVEASLDYLNDGLYAARELDCQQPSASPSPAQPQPSASPTGVVLATTGANTFTLAIAGAALLAFGIGAVLLARRSRV